MGCFGKLFKCLGREEEEEEEKKKKCIKIVLVGLNNAGKTTLLGNLRGIDTSTVTPTWGYSAEKLPDKDMDIEVYDLGGGKNIRRIWERYYAEVFGVIFVVDAADRERLPEAKNVFLETLNDSRVKCKPILVFANKQDLGSALPAAEIATGIGLTSEVASSHSFQILPCSALGGPQRHEDGAGAGCSIREGVSWMKERISTDYRSLKDRVAIEAEEQRVEEERRKAERMKRVEEARALRRKQEDEMEQQEEKGAAKAENENTSSAIAAEDEAGTVRNEQGEGNGDGGERESDDGATLPPLASSGEGTPNAKESPPTGTLQELDSVPDDAPVPDDSPTPSIPGQLVSPSKDYLSPKDVTS